MPSRPLDIEAFAHHRVTRVLTDSVRDYAIFLLDAGGRVLSWNSGAKAIKGYDEDEIVGRSFTVFYTPEDLADGKPQRLLHTAATSGRVEDEGWRVRKDGTRFWADVVISAVREGGRLSGFIKVTRDLTVRRSEEQRLRQSEERLRLLVEGVKDYAIFMLDPQGRVTSWNPGAERINGYRAEEILGRHLAAFYPEEDVRAGKPDRELALAAREGAVHDEGWRVRKDGTRFWATIALRAIRDHAGALVGFAKVTRDDTERKQATDELAARERRQAVVAEFGVYALQTRVLDDVMDRAVEALASTLRVDVAMVLERLADGELLVRACRGCPGTFVGHTLRPGGEESQLGATLLTREPVAVEDFGAEPRLHPPRLPGDAGVRSGVTVVIHTHSVAPYGVLGVHARTRRAFSADEVSFLQAVANVIAAAVDRERAERELRAAEAQAELERDRTSEAREDVRRRDEFISVAAHELRTPLSALQLNLHTLERALRSFAPAAEEGAQRVRTRVGDAIRQTGRLAQLVGRVLDATRIGENQLELKLEQLDLVTLVEEVVLDFEEVAARAGCRLDLEAPSSAVGVWDRTALQEVVANLLSNAIKYGRGQPIAVVLELGEGGGAVRLTVRDRGIGISAEDAARIFRRFERAASAKQFAGLGLGLYITRHIVEAHGGTIGVRSASGEGAAFVIELPTRREAQRESAAAQPAPGPS